LQGARGALAWGQRHSTADDQLLQESTRELMAKVGQDRQNAKIMLDLEDAILHHVNDEREKMFPKARAAQGLDLMKLARQLEARKLELGAAQPA
jgi:hypothetical protein